MNGFKVRQQSGRRWLLRTAAIDSADGLPRSLEARRRTYSVSLSKKFIITLKHEAVVLNDGAGRLGSS